MTTVYRIRHKETGLFYGPKRQLKSGTTNVSTDGKIYPKKPSYDVSIYGGYYHEGTYRRTERTEWEVVPYHLVESIPEPLKD